MMRPLSATLRAAAILGAALAGLDYATGNQAWAGLPAAVGLGLGVGALIGLLLGALGSAFAPVGRFAPLGWPVAGLAAGLYFAHALGGFAKLAGAHRSWAILAIAAGAIGGAGLGLIAALFQRYPDAPRGWLLERPRHCRLAVATGCAAAAVAACWVDRTQLAGIYPVAHQGLRLFALVVLIHAALAFEIAWRRLPVLARRITVVASVAIAALPFALLHGSPREELYAIAVRPFPGAALDLARAVTDVDRDGFSSLLGGGDCRAFDASIHPGAREIPGNGIDENCILGDASVAPETRPAQPAIPREPSPLSVVLITVDALRPDRMSLYGHDRPTTPKLDRWAKDRARVYTRAYTAGARTKQSIPAMMRGVYPRRLHFARFYELAGNVLYRGRDYQRVRPAEQVIAVSAFCVDTAHPTIGDLLARRGMMTAAAIGEAKGIFHAQSGFDAGFQRFERIKDIAPPEQCETESDALTTQLASKLLADRADGQRFFLWVHYFGVHTPNTQHEGFPHFGDREVDAYDHEVAYFDHHVAELLDALDALDEPIAVFITGDHGEIIEQDQRYHGSDLTEPNIRVPFVVAAPGFTPGVDDRLVSTVDLFPTILALTNTPGPAAVDGIDLAKPAPADRFLISEAWWLDLDGSVGHDRIAAYDETAKVRVDRLRSVAKNEGEGDHQRLETAALRYLERTGVGRHITD